MKICGVYRGINDSFYFEECEGSDKLLGIGVNSNFKLVKYPLKYNRQLKF